MRVLPLNFDILRFGGVWRPENCSRFKEFLYSIRTALTLLLLVSFVASELFDALFAFESLDNITSNSIIFLTTLCLCAKLFNLLFARRKVVALINMFLQDTFLPRDSAEMEIRRKYEMINRWLILTCLTLTGPTLGALILIPCLEKGSENRALPVRAWYPYSLSDLRLYRASYVHQSLAMLAMGLLCVTHDTMVAGLLIEICAQLDILKQRIGKLDPLMRACSRECEITAGAARRELLIAVGDCVRHHVSVHRCAASVERIFRWLIFLQFFVTTVTLCSITFQASKNSISNFEFLSLSLFFLCVATQLFVFCWPGNEIILKSSKIQNAVYDTDWTLLGSSASRNLVLMMVRTMQPIKVTSGLFTLSLDTYTTILRASYSAFSVLQQSS